MCLDIQCLLLKSFTWVEQLKISPTSTQKPYSAAKKLGKHLRVSLNRKLSLYVFTDPVYDAQRFKVCLVFMVDVWDFFRNKKLNK